MILLLSDEWWQPICNPRDGSKSKASNSGSELAGGQCYHTCQLLPCAPTTGMLLSELLLKIVSCCLHLRRLMVCYLLLHYCSFLLYLVHFCCYVVRIQFLLHWHLVWMCRFIEISGSLSSSCHQRIFSDTSHVSPISLSLMMFKVTLVSTDRELGLSV